MQDRLLLLTYECKDVTGQYYTLAAVEKRLGKYVAHYVDFPNITSISRNRHDLDYWIPAMIRTLLAEETGIIPSVRLHAKEILIKETA